MPLPTMLYSSHSWLHGGLGHCGGAVVREEPLSQFRALDEQLEAGVARRGPETSSPSNRDIHRDSLTEVGIVLRHSIGANSRQASSPAPPLASWGILMRQSSVANTAFVWDIVLC